MTYNETDSGRDLHKSDPFPNTRKGSISRRLNQLANGRALREVGKKWNVSSSTVDRYINQGSMPAFDKAIDIVEAENVSLQWLASGTDACPQCEKEESQSKPDTYKINKYNVAASAGSGSYIDNERVVESIDVTYNWLYNRNLTGKRLCIIEAQGNSMSPTIDDGDDLLINFNELSLDDALIGLHIIDIDGELRVKRLKYSVVKDGYRIISDNPLYKEEFIPRHELDRMRVIGEVLMVMGKPADGKHEENTIDDCQA